MTQLTNAQIDQLLIDAMKGCEVEDIARALIAEAEDQGLVIEIRQVPLQPLAQGHYRTEATVTPRVVR